MMMTQRTPGEILHGALVDGLGMRTAQTAIGLYWRAAHPGVPPTPARGLEIEVHFWTRSERKDVDNLLKLALDALNSVAFVDDRQIDAAIVRVHRGPDVAPRTEITVRGMI